MWRYNQRIVCRVQRGHLCQTFFCSWNALVELPRQPRSRASPRSLFFPAVILKTRSCRAQLQPLFLFSLSVTTNFCVIPFIRRTMETSHVLAKMHLHAHKANFFTIGPSIGIFSFQQLFAGMEAQQDSVCAAESAAFYRLTDKNAWMANASSLAGAASLQAEPLLTLTAPDAQRTQWQYLSIYLDVDIYRYIDKYRGWDSGFLTSRAICVIFCQSINSKIKVRFFFIIVFTY